MLSFIVICLIIIALAFEFINGFHDTANAVATSISTRSLEPLQAISLSAFFNLLGALSGTAVALTITKGFADPSLATHEVILAALLSAIAWNLFTWYFGIPSSSSHALIGGLVGAIIFNSGWQKINFAAITNKVFIPMVLSPLCGFLLASLLVVILQKFLSKSEQPRKSNNFVREMQVLSTAFLSFSHGSNDAQKTMAIITLTLLNAHIISTPDVPDWVVIVCALTMTLGTLAGGSKIIKTLSTRVAKLQPANGFSAELSSAIVLFLGSKLGIPLSTTHAVSGSIMGAGNVGSRINWSVVRSMIIAWVFTFPCCMLFAGMFLHIINLFS